MGSAVILSLFVLCSTNAFQNKKGGSFRLNTIGEESNIPNRNASKSFDLVIENNAEPHHIKDENITGLTTEKIGNTIGKPGSRMAFLNPTKRSVSKTTSTDTALASSYQVNVSASNRFLATDITAFSCGAKRLCAKNSTGSKGLCTVECDPCHCDDMCHFYGDCCPDLLFKDSPDSPSTPFPHVSCSRETWTVWGNLTYIFMVSSCPAGTSPSVAEKCEKPDIGDQQQATPVSIVRSEVTYRNVFCAQCHDIRDAKQWRHQVKCASDYVVNTARSKAHLWRLVLDDRFCDIDSFPPEDVDPRECFHSEVNSCPENATGLGADPKLKHLCSSFKNTVAYYGPDQFYVGYRNIFCAVCNGEILDRRMPCSRHKGESCPPPLSVLLDFNPTQAETPEVSLTDCPTGMAFDPFSEACRNLTCSERRFLIDGSCHEAPGTADFIGYIVNVILQAQNSSKNIIFVDFLGQYIGRLQEELKLYGPVLVASMEQHYVTEDTDKSWSNTVLINGTVAFLSNRSDEQFDNHFLDILSKDVSLITQGETTKLFSRPHLCSNGYQPPHGRMVSPQTQTVILPQTVNPDCTMSECLADVKYKPVPLSCPYIEYVDRFEENFIFDPISYDLEYRNHTFPLKISEFRCCGRNLKICKRSLDHIKRTLFERPNQEEQNLGLSILSLVCISLSLLGLLLTFLVYSFVPKLRTLPGKNTMALMFHLFLAQLLFLTTSNRTENVVLCQVFGVLIHYFWLSSFTWMLVSAFHMYTVFKELRVYISHPAGDTKRIILNISFSIIVPICIIVSCIIWHHVQSNGTEIGYGGDVCFLSNPTAIFAFFAGPLGLILLVNTFFFTKTVLSIRRVPDMKESTNKAKKCHVIVYIKLCFLFGFTWIFGIVAQIFKSDVLQYIFVLSTGSQGVMIFLAYCANKRTLLMLKASVLGTASDYTSGKGTPAPSDKTKSSVLKTRMQ